MRTIIAAVSIFAVHFMRPCQRGAELRGERQGGDARDRGRHQPRARRRCFQLQGRAGHPQTPARRRTSARSSSGRTTSPSAWLDNRNLKLRIYRERASEPHGYVDLVIEAWPRKDSDGIEFRGGYRSDDLRYSEGRRGRQDHGSEGPRDLFGGLSRLKFTHPHQLRRNRTRFRDYRTRINHGINISCAPVRIRARGVISVAG